MPSSKNILSRLFRKAWISQLREPFWFLLPLGFWMRLDPNQFLDRTVLIEDVWDPSLTMLIQQFVRVGDTCIDIGAHKGYVSCLLASLVGSSGMVLSFEPDPRAFSLLLQNFQRNQFSQARAFPSAAGAQDGTISLVLTKTLGWSSQYPNALAQADATEKIMVKCIQIDTDQTITSLLSQRKALSFLKIDAEGTEPEIWQGMVETIRKYKPLISMEINYASLAAGGFDVRKFHDTVMQAGYTEFFEAVILEERSRSPRCVLRRLDITKERPLLVDAVIANPESSFHSRLIDIIE